MVYKMNIAGIEHELPLCRVTDDLYIGAFVVFGHAKLTVACARDLLKIAPEYDYLLTAEAKGIPLAHEMARQHEDDMYFIARKYPKLYMTGVFEVVVNSITTDKQQKLYLDTAEAEMMRGKRILIVDDVISTGESLAALEKLVQHAGGIVAGRMAVLAEGDAQNRDDILYLEKLPLFNADGTVK
ncbi:MAG: adenine phosphoribosyltransferase [Clostridia bacterium]|nr:adenine phosphoribosyltransferase [Clostridia bacterium]